VHAREHSGAGHGEQRHGFGEAVDGIAPGLSQQQKDGGDKRAGVADSDPPDEVDDGEAPADGDGHAPDADALQKQIADGVQHHHGQHESEAEADEPSVGRGAGQHDGADLFRDRAEGVAGLDDRSLASSTADLYSSGMRLAKSLTGLKPRSFVILLRRG
jgi:hypothetical protein